MEFSLINIMLDILNYNLFCDNTYVSLQILKNNHNLIILLLESSSSHLGFTSSNILIFQDIFKFLIIKVLSRIILGKNTIMDYIHL